MKALRGMSKADTLRLAEIEHYVATGKRPDDLHVTDEWVDEAMKFLAGELRPTIDAWGEAADEQEREAMVAMEARKLCRLWRKGVNGEQREAAFKSLDKAIQNAEAARK